MDGISKFSNVISSCATWHCEITKVEQARGCKNALNHKKQDNPFEWQAVSNMNRAKPVQWIKYKFGRQDV